MRKHVVKLLIGAGCVALLLSLSYKIRMNRDPFPKHLLGPAKSRHTLAEMQAHPILLWGIQVNDREDADGVMGGDETGKRAWLGPPNVTRDMTSPEILLRVKGTNLWAVGLYDGERKRLDALGVFGPDGRRPPSWYIQSPGVPITYVAVPSIEGRQNVEFVAKNRKRDRALMAGEFTPAETEQQYEDELSENRTMADSPVTLLRKNPELLQLAVVFLQRVAHDVLPKTSGVVFTDVAGWLEDEDPALFQRLIKETTVEQLRFRPCSCATGAEGLIVDSETGEHGIFVILTNWKREGDAYTVTGYWISNSNQMHNVAHRISKADGSWQVQD